MIEAPSAAEFCSIINTSGVKGGWSGSAFRSHPKGIFRERMIFTNEWHVNKYCSVKVMTNPEAKLVLGCQDPAAYGNPYPTASQGELVVVYRNGEWVADGPWCERIVAILEDVRTEKEEIAARKKAKDEARQMASKAAAERSLDAARGVFS